MSIQSRKKHIGRPERDSVGVRMLCFSQNSPYMASRHLLIPRIAAAGTSFSPLPYQASHDYMATNVARVEVEVGADGHARAPPSGPPPLRRGGGTGTWVLSLSNQGTR
jgi:hypothetical protein